MLESMFLWIHQLDGDAQNLLLINGCFTTIFVHFFANNKKLFHKTEIPTVILRCFSCLNYNWIKSYDVKHNVFHFASF